MISSARKADIRTMGSTDQVTFANTVLLIVMGIMLILIVVGLGLFGYRYQRTQVERKQQEAANLAAVRFESERAKVLKEARADSPQLEQEAPASASISQVPEQQEPRSSRRKPSNPDNLPRRSLR